MKRFNILPAGMSQGKSFRRIEHEFGEWVRWEDMQKAIVQLKMKIYQQMNAVAENNREKQLLAERANRFYEDIINEVFK